MPAGVLSSKSACHFLEVPDPAVRRKLGTVAGVGWVTVGQVAGGTTAGEAAADVEYQPAGLAALSVGSAEWAEGFGGRAGAGTKDGRVGRAVVGSLGPGAAEVEVRSAAAGSGELGLATATATVGLAAVLAAAVDTGSNFGAAARCPGCAEQRFPDAG